MLKPDEKIKKEIDKALSPIIEAAKKINFNDISNMDFERLYNEIINKAIDLIKDDLKEFNTTINNELKININLEEDLKILNTSKKSLEDLISKTNTSESFNTSPGNEKLLKDLIEKNKSLKNYQKLGESKRDFILEVKDKIPSIRHFVKYL